MSLPEGSEPRRAHAFQDMVTVAVLKPDRAFPDFLPQ
jgi:hypothetical protein